MDDKNHLLLNWGHHNNQMYKKMICLFDIRMTTAGLFNPPPPYLFNSVLLLKLSGGLLNELITSPSPHLHLLNCCCGGRFGIVKGQTKVTSMVITLLPLWICYQVIFFFFLPELSVRWWNFMEGRLTVQVRGCKSLLKIHATLFLLVV